jgi:hypothetical protein
MQIALVARRGREAFSLPLRALLYRRKKDCGRRAPYQEKWRLALELLNSLHWPHGVRLVADGNFYVRPFVRAIREAGHDLIVRLPKVAAVYGPTPSQQSGILVSRRFSPFGWDVLGAILPDRARENRR